MRNNALFLAALLAAVMPVSSAVAAAGEVGPNLDWISPTPESRFDAVSQRYTLHDIGPTLYWSTQWFWQGKNNGGYAGVQTDGVRADGSRGGMAIFSVWDATEAEPGPGSACIPFGGEGVGMSCRAPFQVAAGHTYRVDVAIADLEENKKWWKVTVTDESTGRRVLLGRIAAPRDTAINVPSSFLEYFGPAKSCDRPRLVETYFESPVLSPEGGGEPVSATKFRRVPRSCALAVVNEAPNGVEMGAYIP